MDNIKSKMKDYWEYVVSNKEEVIVYILLIVGILSLFFNIYFGELILGVLTGFYFNYELVNLIQHIREMYKNKGRVRYIVFLGLLISLLIFVPTYVFITLIIAAIKQMFARN